MSKIFLLGTMHLDIRSAPILYKVLSGIEPELITVEISRYSVNYRQMKHIKWQQCLKRALKRIPVKKRSHPQIRLLRRQISMPYEWTTALAYAKYAHIPCLPIDTGKIAKQELPKWQNSLLTIENVKFLVKEPWFDLESYFLKCHNFAQKLWKEPDLWQLKRNLAFLHHSIWQEREQIMAARLKRLQRLNKRLVHIGGWLHLLHSPSHATLYSRLEKCVYKKKLIARSKN